jgi:hypothetical protein
MEQVYDEQFGRPRLIGASAYISVKDIIIWPASFHVCFLRMWQT